MVSAFRGVVRRGVVRRLSVMLDGWGVLLDRVKVNGLVQLLRIVVVLLGGGEVGVML